MNQIRPTWLFLFFLTTFSTSVWAQIPRFTQYRSYWGIINPAAPENHFYEFNGIYDIALTLSHRSEGLSQNVETPNTQLLQLSWVPPIGNRFKILTGGYWMQDQFGPTQVRNGALRIGAFSYDSPYGHLSLGFNLGFKQFSFNLQDSDFTSLGDQVLNINLEPSFFDLGFGLFYSQRLDKHDWYIGFSMPQLFDWDRQQKFIEEQATTIFGAQTYILLGAHIYPSNHRYWEPSIWFKHLPEEVHHVDFNLRHHWIKSQLWIGAGYSTQNTLHVEFGFDIGTLNASKRGLRIGFGYDHNTSILPTGTDHAFEINLRFLFR